MVKFIQRPAMPALRKQPSSGRRVSGSSGRSTPLCTSAVPGRQCQCNPDAGFVSVSGARPRHLTDTAHARPCRGGAAAAERARRPYAWTVQDPALLALPARGWSTRSGPEKPPGRRPAPAGPPSDPGRHSQDRLLRTNRPREGVRRAASAHSLLEEDPNAHACARAHAHTHTNQRVDRRNPRPWGQSPPPSPTGPGTLKLRPAGFRVTPLKRGSESYRQFSLKYPSPDSWPAPRNLGRAAAANAAGVPARVSGPIRSSGTLVHPNSYMNS